MKIEVWNLVVASNTLQSSLGCSNDLFLKFRKVPPLELEHALKSAGRAPSKAETFAVLQRRFAQTNRLKFLP